MIELFFVLVAAIVVGGLIVRFPAQTLGLIGLIALLAALQYNQAESLTYVIVLGAILLIAVIHRGTRTH